MLIGVNFYIVGRDFVGMLYSDGIRDLFDYIYGVKVRVIDFVFKREIIKI